MTGCAEHVTAECGTLHWDSGLHSLFKQNSADLDVDPKRRRGKLDKTQNSVGLPAKGKAVMVSVMIPSAPPAKPDCVEMTKEVREAMFEILHMSRRITGLDKMALSK